MILDTTRLFVQRGLGRVAVGMNMSLHSAGHLWQVKLSRCVHAPPKVIDWGE